MNGVCPTLFNKFQSRVWRYTNHYLVVYILCSMGTLCSMNGPENEHTHTHPNTYPLQCCTYLPVPKAIYAFALVPCGSNAIKCLADKHIWPLDPVFRRSDACRRDDHSSLFGRIAFGLSFFAGILCCNANASVQTPFGRIMYLEEHRRTLHMLVWYSGLLAGPILINSPDRLMCNGSKGSMQHVRLF